ncbi:heparinase II/III domain-containing protein [Bacillus niameyensis]|uniref:heparinase II/III domain-containing protein n=1 Tax=Bacillus niameyensis TaxID=1522308 RepID=UPI000784CE1F|nr:heparinase II/III family protein [Bacillus niameyensis]
MKDLITHPRILFTKDEIANADTPPQLLAQAKRFLTETEFQVSYPMINYQLTVSLPLQQLATLPEPKGYVDFPYWTMYSRAIEERITVLGKAYGLTKKREYGEKVKEYILALARFERWFEFPHRGAEGNLSNAHFTLAMASGYDAIFDLLDEQEKDIVQTAILEKGLHPFEIDFDNKDSHNIIASKRVAMLVGALAILEEKEVEPYFTNAYEYLLAYLDERLVSPENEGLLYTKVAAQHILLAADTLHRATGDGSLIAHPYFKEFLPELFLFMLGNSETASFANFSDSFYSLDIDYMMSMIAKKNQHPVASWYVQNFSNEKEHRVESIPPDLYYASQKSQVFPTIGWTSFRNGWSKKSHLLAFLSSESAKDHNHFDQNNFILHTDGEWLITNPGYQDYVAGPRREFTLGTIGHNSMLVNGKGQVYLGKSKIVDSFLSERFDYCIGDATRAYGDAIKLWERQIIHVDQTYFMLIDRVLKKEAHDQLSFLYHTTGTPMVNLVELQVDELIKENKIDFVGENACASIYPCYPQMMNKAVKVYTGAEEFGPYLQVEPNSDLEQEILVTLIHPDGNEKLEPVVNLDGGKLSLRIERDFKVDYFLMNIERRASGMVSEDGLFSIYGEQGWLSKGKSQNVLSKVVLINGSEIHYGDQLLFQSNKDLNAVVMMEKGSPWYQVDVTEETVIHAHFENDRLQKFVLPRGSHDLRRRL